MRKVLSINLKKRFFLVSLIFFFNSFFGINFYSFAATNNKKDSDEFNIGTDYLEKLPESDYIVGPGDSLRVIVSRDYPELETIAVIDGEGTIFLPKLNRVYVEGLSLNELKNILNKAFKKYVKYPDVELLITNYRPIRVMVEGEVENPGLQTLEGAITLEGSINLGDSINNEYNSNQTNTNFSSDNYALNNYSSNNIQKSKGNSYYFPTVFDVIRQSGGITEYSDLSKVKVIRKDKLSAGGGKVSTELNFTNLILNGDSSQNIRVYDSDTIVVSKSNYTNKELLRKAVVSNLNPKFVNVFVTGRVNTPGNIKVSKASVLTDAVAMAGGAKALKGPVTFIRFNNDGSIDKRKFGFSVRAKRDSYKNPLLKNGDLIFIGESLLTTTNEVITAITAPITGVFSSYGLYKAITSD